MKTLTTQAIKVNGKFDVYATEETKRTQNYSDLAYEKGRNWDEMSNRARANFRRKNQKNIEEVETKIEVFEITAKIPNIFSEFQLKKAFINHLIHPTDTIFLACKNGKTGYSTTNFKIK